MLCCCAEVTVNQRLSKRGISKALRLQLAHSKISASSEHSLFKHTIFYFEGLQLALHSQVPGAIVC